MNDSSSLLGAQITSSAMIVFLWRFVESKFPKVAGLGPKLKRTFTWVLAGLAAVGIHATFNGYSLMGGGVISLAIPSLPVLGHAIFEWLRSVAVQEWLHQSTRPAPPSPVKP